MYVGSDKHANCFPRLSKLRIAWDCVCGGAGSTSAKDAAVPIATPHLPF